LGKKYGRLPDDWQAFIRQGFAECWRVLKTNGTLVFKWNTRQFGMSAIIRCIGREPLYGQRLRKGVTTHWLCFVQTNDKEGALG
jgi:hypothetical protein